MVSMQKIRIPASQFMVLENVELPATRRLKLPFPTRKVLRGPRAHSIARTPRKAPPHDALQDPSMARRQEQTRFE